MKPLCPKCLCTHWEDQACKVKSLAELPKVFPSPPDLPDIPEVTTEALTFLQKLTSPIIHVDLPEPAEVATVGVEFIVKPKKILSKAHLAALKAGREAKKK